MNQYDRLRSLGRIVNVLMLVDSPDRSGAFWRHSGPLSELRQQVPVQFNFTSVEQVTWLHIAMADLVFMQRPFSEAQLAAFNKAKSQLRPVWLDYDDDLLDIPFDNATHDIYMTKKSHDSIRYMIANCDALSVSTHYLGEKYSQFTKAPIYLLPNSYDEKKWHWRDVSKEAERLRVVWRGSRHHQKDLWAHTQDIREVYEKFGDKIEWVFVGFKPVFILEGWGDNWIHIGESEVDKFHKVLHSIRPDIVMAPLFDYGFNRAKSNIAWVEATMSGGACVCPDWEEWKRPGTIRYTKEKPFKETLIEAIELGLSNRKALHDKCEESFKYIKKELTLEQMNLVRAEIMANLLKCRKVPVVRENAPSKNQPKSPDITC